MKRGIPGVTNEENMVGMFLNNLKSIIATEEREMAMYKKTPVEENTKKRDENLKEVKRMYSTENLFEGIVPTGAIESEKRDNPKINELVQTWDQIMYIREKLEDLRYLVRAGALEENCIYKETDVKEEFANDCSLEETKYTRMDEPVFLKLEEFFGLESDSDIYKEIEERLNEINPSRQDKQNVPYKETLEVERVF